MLETYHGGSFKALEEKDVRCIHEATVQILETVGVKVHNSDAFNLFRDKGAVVDPENKVVKIPRSMLEEALTSAPSRVVLCGREQKYDLELESTRTYFGTGGTVLNTLDLDSGERRPTRLKDVRDYARMTDALENVHFFVINVYPTELPAEKVDVNRFFWAMQGTSKHIMGGIYTLEGLKQVIKMAESIAGGRDSLLKRPFISFITLVMSPLTMDATYTSFMMEAAGLGIPLAVPSEPLAGATGPVTLAGTVTINNAETLAGVVLTQLVNPGTPVLYGTTSSTMEMRTGVCLAGSVESALINASMAQMAQYYEIPIYATGGMSDSKLADAQAGYESSATAMLVGLSGANFIHDAAGIIEFCTTAAYEKMVLDNENLGIVLRAIRGVEAGPEQIAHEVIASVGPGGNFLAHPHTLKYLRSEYFYPRVFDRLQREQWQEEGAKDAATRAREVARKILSTHNSLGFDPQKETKLRQAFPAIENP